MEYGLSQMSQNDGVSIEDLIAERDELLQKLQNEAEEKERLALERDEILAAESAKAAADADEMAELRNSLAQVCSPMCNLLQVTYL